MVERLKSFFSTLWYIITAYFHYITGKRFEGRHDRRKICDICHFKKGIFCGQCGCIIKVKTNEENAECPESFWI